MGKVPSGDFQRLRFWTASAILVPCRNFLVTHVLTRYAETVVKWLALVPRSIPKILRSRFVNFTDNQPGFADRIP